MVWLWRFASPCNTNSATRFAGAHNIGRAHGLVGRDQHETLDSGSNSRLGGTECAEHVILYALDHILFDQWHVFVGSGMVNRFDAEAFHRVGDLSFLVIQSKVKSTFFEGKMRRAI